MSYQVIVADVMDGLSQLEDCSVQCVVTSPPYWGLRDYGVDGQIGIEESPEQYIENMVEVFREVRRVLRKDGTLWLNMGDSYYNCSPIRKKGSEAFEKTFDPSQAKTRGGKRRYPKAGQPWGLKMKSLCGMPWRLAIALQADGWILRSDIIWHKPNPMPESVGDRPTRSHEYIFLMTKAARYFYDADAVREIQSWKGGAGNRNYRSWSESGREDLGQNNNANPLGRNHRTVWTIPTKPFPEAHFATFPEALVRPCIQAGTSSYGCCVTCRAPWKRLTETTYENPGNRTTNGPRSIEQRHETAGFAVRKEKRVQTVGWEPGCDHDDESVPCIVLDPFSGSGTTGVVAMKLDRDYIGIELKPEYAALSEERLKSVETGIPVKELRGGQIPMFGGGE